MGYENQRRYEDFISEEIDNTINDLKSKCEQIKENETKRKINEYLKFLDLAVHKSVEDKNPFSSLSLLSVMESIITEQPQKIGQTLLDFFIAQFKKIKNLLLTLITPKEWTVSGDIGTNFYEIFNGKVHLEIKFGK